MVEDRVADLDRRTESLDREPKVSWIEDQELMFAHLLDAIAALMRFLIQAAIEAVSTSPVEVAVVLLVDDMTSMVGLFILFVEVEVLWHIHL
jgi:hypothetical protein